MLEFSHEDIHQGKEASENTTFGWVSLEVSVDIQTCVDLQRVPLGSHRGIVRLKLKSNSHLVKMLVLFASMKAFKKLCKKPFTSPFFPRVSKCTQNMMYKLFQDSFIKN